MFVLLFDVVVFLNCLIVITVVVAAAAGAAAAAAAVVVVGVQLMFGLRKPGQTYGVTTLVYCRHLYNLLEMST